MAFSNVYFSLQHNILFDTGFFIIRDADVLIHSDILYTSLS